MTPSDAQRIERLIEELMSVAVWAKARSLSPEPDQVRVIQEAADLIARLRVDAKTAERKGINAAADWVRDRRWEHEKENGYIEPDTNALSYGRGPRADAMEEMNCEWCEIEDGIRALAATAPMRAEKEDGRG